MKGQWTKIYNGNWALRSWWVDSGNEWKYVSIVLPEVFAINNWIRSFSEKLDALIKRKDIFAPIIKRGSNPLFLLKSENKNLI